jgi:hypothetical protein
MECIISRQDEQRRLARLHELSGDAEDKVSSFPHPRSKRLNHRHVAAQLSDGTVHAFLWTRQQGMQAASSINDAGEIVGWGQFLVSVQYSSHAEMSGGREWGRERDGFRDCPR